MDDFFDEKRISLGLRSDGLDQIRRHIAGCQKTLYQFVGIAWIQLLQKDLAEGTFTKFGLKLRVPGVLMGVRAGEKYKQQRRIWQGADQFLNQVQRKGIRPMGVLQDDDKSGLLGLAFPE